MKKSKRLVAGHIIKKESAIGIINFIEECLAYSDIKYTLSKLNNHYYVYFWLSSEQYKYICSEYKKYIFKISEVKK